MASVKVNPSMLIPQIKQGFKKVLKRPALRNLILVILACLGTKTFQINTLANHLPVCVAYYKTKQKRLLRFIDANFPTLVAMGAWCAFVLWQSYMTKQGVRHALCLWMRRTFSKTIGLSLSLCHSANALFLSIGKSTKKTPLTRWSTRAIMCLFKSFAISSSSRLKLPYRMSKDRS